MARALVNDPQLILADEPTGNLDTASGAGIMQLLAELHQNGRTVLVVTHDPRMSACATNTVHMLDCRQVTLALVAFTPQSFIQGINGFYTVLQIIMGGVEAIALLVAAIGIANTMAMSILERTREIGLMKAVGATNRHVLSVFLGESAGIGFLGGLGGVLLGWRRWLTSL